MEKLATADLLVARRAGSGHHEPVVRGSGEVVGADDRADGSWWFDLRATTATPYAMDRGGDLRGAVCAASGRRLACWRRR